MKRVSEIAKVDPKGRIVLPKAIRKELKIEPGAFLWLTLQGGIVKVKRAESPFAEKQRIKTKGDEYG